MGRYYYTQFTLHPGKGRVTSEFDRGVLVNNLFNSIDALIYNFEDKIFTKWTFGSKHVFYHFLFEALKRHFAPRIKQC